MTPADAVLITAAVLIPAWIFMRVDAWLFPSDDDEMQHW